MPSSSSTTATTTAGSATTTTTIVNNKKFDIGSITKLNGDNYRVWKMRLSSLFRTHNIMDIVDGTKVRPTDAAGQVIWDQGNNEATTAMFLSMTDEEVDAVSGCTSANGIWTKLDTMYQSVSGESKQVLWQKYYSVMSTPDKSPVKTMVEIQNYASQLRTMGVTIDDDMEVARVISSLMDNKFRNFREAWRSVEVTNQTTALLLSRLKTWESDEEQSAKARNSNESPKAYTAGKNIKQKKSKEELMEIKKKSKCHLCKRKGHWKNECPDNDKKKAESSESTSSQKPAAYIVEQFGTHVNEWVNDSGADRHYCGRLEWFKEYEKYSQPKLVVIADNSSMEALGMGTVLVKALINEQWRSIELQNVEYIPGGANLFSENILLGKGFEVKKNPTGRIVYFKNGKPDIEAQLKDGLQIMRFRPVEIQAFSCVKQAIWHQRLGHINSQYLKNTAAEGAAFGLEKMNNESYKCEICVQAKSKKQSYRSSSSEKHYKPAECLHADLAYATVSSYRGNNYFLVIKDEASSFRQVYFQKSKNEAVKNLKDAINFIANQTGSSVKMLRSDNGTEFKNAEFESFLSEKGIQFGLNAPYTSESNGLVEREVRIEQEAARAMLIQSQLSEKHWDDAICTAVYILNRTLSSKNKKKTPFEMVFGKKPSLHHVRTFGCKAFVHVMNNNKKWEAKAVECILVGYNSASKNYILYVPSKGSYIEQAKHVDFLENCEDSNEIESPVKDVVKLNTGDDESMEIQQETEYMDEEGLIPAQPLPELSFDTSGVSSWAEDVEMDQSELQQQPEGRPIRNRRQVEKFQAGFQATTKYLEPVNYKDAVSCSEAEEWKEAMDSEIRSQQAMGTWHLVKRPRHKKVLQNRWVYKIKTDPNGNIEKFKARLVVKGCHQVEGVDYEETFAPVSRYETIRILLSTAAERDWKMLQFDIATAFLNSTLEDEVYMEQPQGYSTGHDLVCRLDRGVYGLKQAPRGWHRTITKKLVKMGFVALECDPCVYRKQIHEDTIFIVLYVDDGLILGPSMADLKDELKDLEEAFKVTVQPADRFLGIEIIQNGNGIFLHQQKYINDMLERFDMSECKVLDIPMHPGLQLQRMSPADMTYEFQELIGSLLFLARCTRPDITYAVHYLSRFFAAYSKQHWDAAKRILQYLQGTKNLGILYKKKNCNNLCGYVDADYGSDIESRKSTTGCVFLFNESPVVWLSKRQTCVALSSTESEYVALAHAGKEAVWLRRIYSELDMPTDGAICLKTDSQSAIKLAKNPEYHDKTKHIDIRNHYIRWLVNTGQVSLDYIPDQVQPADILTKSVVKEKFVKKRQLMGMQELLKEPSKRKALSSIIVDPKRPNMFWSLPLLFLLFFCFIPGGNCKLHRDSNPVIWRKSLDPVFTGFQAVTMDLKLVSPCSLISVEGLSPRVSSILIRQCELAYQEIFLDNLEIICPKEQTIGHKEERGAFILFGILLAVGIGCVGVAAVGHAFVKINALETRQGALQKKIDELSHKIFVNKKLIEKLEKQVQTVASRVDYLSDDLNSFKEKTVELQFITAYLTSRMMEGRKILKETGSHWRRGKLTSDLFEFLNFTLPCAEECPMEHGIFHSCNLSVNRDEMLMEFAVPIANPKLVRVEADQFDLMARNGSSTCRLKYRGPLVATISVEEDCVYETRMERPRTNLELTILSSCKNNSFDEMEHYYGVDKCKNTEPGDEKEFIQVKFFNNEYHIYCYGSFYTIGNRQVECPENVFTLPLSLTFTLNDVVYKGSLLKVIYEEEEDHYLREQIDHHLNQKMVSSNLSATLVKDWDDSKKEIESSTDDFIYVDGNWTWSEIVVLVILFLVLGGGLVLGMKYLKRRFCARENVEVKKAEVAPLTQAVVGTTCDHRIIVT